VTFEPRLDPWDSKVFPLCIDESQFAFSLIEKITISLDCQKRFSTLFLVRPRLLSSQGNTIAPFREALIPCFSPNRSLVSSPVNSRMQGESIFTRLRAYASNMIAKVRWSKATPGSTPTSYYSISPSPTGIRKCIEEIAERM
jgi:hypothetical protein